MQPPAPHRARKRFGQNFLQDTQVIGRCLAAIDARPGQHLVEIGPGRGALTYDLLTRAGELDVIELDRDLIPILEAHCAPLLRAGRRLNIHNVDALKFDYASLAPAGGRLRVVGNLPYNISTPLLFHLLRYAGSISDMHFMLQKEVVERIAAAPGDRNYGRLSVMVQYRCQPEILFHVPPEAFRPAPKVESAFLRLRPYQRLPVHATDEALLAQTVAQAFSQRRKTLRNALKSMLSATELQALDIDPGRRPETLSVGEFVRIADHCAADAD